jgi:hypothetical protein
MKVHTVESTSETVRSGFLDPSAPPVATIEPGDVVSYPDTWFHWGNEAKFGMTFAEREPLRHRYPNGPYSMVGPVEVTGAERGTSSSAASSRCGPRPGGGTRSPLASAPCRPTSPSLTCTISASTTPGARPSTCRASRSPWPPSWASWAWSPPGRPP